MRHNIGVALAIPRDLAGDLEDWRASTGDPDARLIQAHITLLPPTPVSDLDVVEEHLRQVASRHEQFAIRLAGTGTFRPVSPVVYVRVQKGAEQIATLESDVRSGPLSRRLRFEFHPHVTVAHDVPEEALNMAQKGLADYEATFTADAITMFAQNSDRVWNPVSRFPLRPAA